MGAILSTFREDNSAKEQENFIRMFFLLNTSTKCVRKVFDREFHPEKLKEVLNKNSHFLLSFTDKRQQLKINPPGGKPTSKNFDLTLMILLLRHLAGKTNISNTFPFESDYSLEADLSRLKWYRNEIVHDPSFQIETKTFERYSNDIIQVNGRLGGCELIETSKQIIFVNLEFHINVVKLLLMQLMIILHNKGCDLSRKVSEKFWYFPPLHQLRIVLSYLKSHFWIFPTMYIIWDEFQDSYNDDDSNAMFFHKTECQEDGYFSKYTDLLKRLSPIHVATPIGESHTFEIECKNCPFLPKWDCKMTADQTQINIIKMICSCKKKSVEGELCYTTLFAQLDPRLYTHDKGISFNNNHFILTNKDCTHKNEVETNDGETYKALNREKLLFTKIPRVSGEEQNEDKTYTPLKRLVAEEGSFVMGNLNVSVLHRNHFPRYQTGYNSGLCETVCLDQNLLN